jgi:AI-2 transport protein TqsA
VFEPIAFVLFAMALVEPFQQAAAARLGKGVALTLTLLLTLLVLAILVWAIVWSIGDIVHWGVANVDKFQSLYVRTTQWLEGHDLFVGDLESLNSFSFIGVFQAVAGYVNYFLGFAHRRGSADPICSDGGDSSPLPMTAASRTTPSSRSLTFRPTSAKGR